MASRIRIRMKDEASAINMLNNCNKHYCVTVITLFMCSLNWMRWLSPQLPGTVSHTFPTAALQQSKSSAYVHDGGALSHLELAFSIYALPYCGCVG